MARADLTESRAREQRHGHDAHRAADAEGTPTWLVVEDWSEFQRRG